ncbi:MAG: hypothetical protein Q27BPR15_16705 [Rhodobacter sp. CACIA14H1]|nr:MAG: hypothetical protein Q27BPR15_16705 [Rhodobacter sp. CACIA14H1]
MNMIEAVKAVFSKYATFEGRARRSEYWWFVLFNIIVSILLSVLFGRGHMEGGGMMAGGNLASTLWWLATLLPGIAVGVRRLHDIDRTGWWLLLAFIPLIGTIVLIVFFASRGTAGPNRFGNDPLQA